MGILLLVLGLLAAASGGLKLRVRTRSLVGMSRLAVAEVIMGALMVLGSGAGLARLRPTAWTAVVAVSGLIVLSAVMHVRRAARHQRQCEASEGERLKRYLEP
jgi:hypothetical protein